MIQMRHHPILGLGPEYYPPSYVLSGPLFLRTEVRGRPVTGKEPRSKGIKISMPREADYYSPGEAARMLGLAEFTVLGLLTSGQLEGQQDEQARWWIPATAVDEAVRRNRGIET